MMSSGGVITLGVYFSPHSLALLASLNQLWRLNHFLNSSVNLLHSSMDCLTVVASSGISSVMASSGIACSGKSSVMASSVASISGTRMAIAIGLVGARVAVSTIGSAVSTNLRARAGEARAVAVVLQGGLGDLGVIGL